MAKPLVLVTDFDNTLYDFAAYFSPCFRAMVHALARETKLEEQVLISDFQAVYEQHKTIEYAFSVQELPSLANLPSLEISRLVHIATVAFGRTRRQRFQ